jgi:TP901 family phage tail tape measure protein
MLNSSFGLGFVLWARDAASHVMTRVERSFRSLDDAVTGGEERLSAAFGGISTGMSMLAAGAVGVAASFALASTSGRFSEAIAAVDAVAGGAGENLEAFRDAAMDAGIATQFAPTEAALGLRELAQAGFTARQSIGLLQPALDLAAGSLGELSPQESAGLAAQALKAFGLEGDQAGITVDRLLQSVNLFALSANELPLALGTASRGAQTMNQSLSETLLALGLVKNVIPSVERSSTAVAVAMERMAEPEAQKQLRRLGVEVTNAQGEFRGFLDILGELAPELDRMTAQERSSFLLKTFGREALGGVNAILKQITTGVQTSTGEMVKGADAIAYLRGEMEDAGGTAEKFREAMLGTFEGQKKLLSGSMETLRIQLGRPFEEVLAPLLSVITAALNAVLQVLALIPAPVKKAFAGFFLFASSAVGVAGAIIAAKASLALLSIGMAALGITLSPVLAVLAAVTAAMAALAVAGAAVYLAYKNNFGGLRDVVDRVVSRVSLAVRGLAQLFQDGVLSGAVLDELTRTENEGVLSFVTKAWQFVHRMEAVWNGFKEGVLSALEVAGPVFSILSWSFEQLATAFGLAGGDIGATVNGLPSERFRQFGALIGYVAGGIMAVLAAVVSAFAAVVAGLARFHAGAVSIATSIVRAVGSVVKWIADVLRVAFDDIAEMWPSWLEPFSELAVGAAGPRTGSAPPALPEPMSVMPSAEEAGARSAAFAGMENLLMSRSQDAERPIQVASTLVLDGETVARSVHNVNRAEAARSFSALPAY